MRSSDTDLRRQQTLSDREAAEPCEQSNALTMDLVRAMLIAPLPNSALASRRPPALLSRPVRNRRPG